MNATEACSLLVVKVREVSAYRLLLQEALGLLHQSHVELERTRKAYHDLLDEARALRRASRPAA